ncbi:TPA: helix-turn-helix transcriptional regulator [Escherichia coli]|nr:helix-turn-helix transcriptional regulator [Escherichia coli]EIK2406514.1 helix-turn-helix transcriptional regulator [Escherichia coli]HEN9594246.1 helix-turn-helix transcriptional regulator [Escherichia coli]HEN9703447.1 helix-turn-helix transcriptional regulator [Escherichia coli]
MTGWELRIWRKSMLWSREKAAREFGVTQRTWHAWENAEQVRILAWREQPFWRNVNADSGFT